MHVPIPLSQSDINSIAVVVLLLLILYFVSNVSSKFRIFKRDSLHIYHNTQAKIKAIDFAPSAIITIDWKGRVLTWNPAAQKMFGHSEKEILGKSLNIIVPQRYHAAHEAGLLHAEVSIENKLAGRTIDSEGLRKDGTEFPVRITVWRWKDNNIVFYTGIVSDVTQEKTKELHINQLLEMYKRAEEIDDSGVWSWDIINDIVYTSKGFDKIYDIEDRERMDANYIVRRVYHEDLPKVEANIVEYFAGRATTIQHRIVTRNGNIIKVEVTGEPQFNKKGEVISIIGTSRKV